MQVRTEDESKSQNGNSGINRTKKSLPTSLVTTGFAIEMVNRIRKLNHEERLEIAGQQCGRILDIYGESVLAVFIYGSTAKALDRPYSDLEMKCVVKDGFEIQTKYYLYRGLNIVLSYRQESAFLEAARKVTVNWPVEADMYRNRITLFERDGWTKNLEKAVAQSETTDIAPAVRYAAVLMTNSLGNLRNALFSGDSRGIVGQARAIARQAAHLVILLNHRYVTTSSQFWKQVFECPWQPQDFSLLVETAAGFAPANQDEIVKAAERLYAQVLEMVESRGISIESDDLLV